MGELCEMGEVREVGDNWGEGSACKGETVRQLFTLHHRVKWVTDGLIVWEKFRNYERINGRTREKRIDPM